MCRAVNLQMPPYSTTKTGYTQFHKGTGNPPRGQMTTIILDDPSFHNPLRQSDDVDQNKFRKSALQGLLDSGHHSELHKSGIDIVITSSKEHEHVKKAYIIKKIRFLLASALKHGFTMMCLISHIRWQ